VSLKDAAAAYGLSHVAVRKRASREKWPQPLKLAQEAAAESAAVTPPSLVAKQSWADRGEQHRAQVFELARKALQAAKPRRLEEWADIERAARLADRAAGLDKPGPVVSLHFPQVQSSEASAVIDLSTNDAPTPLPP
jgi:transcription elongation GreA/GreB family factor